jgi:hypothetical protein
MKQYPQFRLFRAAIAIAACCIVTSSSLLAGMLGQKTRPCPLGSPYDHETWTLFEDDCTGKTYSVLVTCEGHVWMNVPPDWSVGTFGGGDSNPFPPQFWEMIDRANFTTPGEPAGYYIYNIFGQPVWFLNPRNAQEQAAAETAYVCTFGKTLQ